MNQASFFGILFGLILIIGAILLGIYQVDILTIHAPWGIFLNIPSLMIVLGGSLAASMIAYQDNTLALVFRSAWKVLTRPSPNYRAQKNEILHLALLATQGNLVLEKAVRRIRNPFLRDGIQMLADDYRLDEIEDILGQRIEYRIRKEQQECEVIRTIARFSPAFGMTGTLIGLVIMLSRLSLASDAMSHIGSDMAVALITTFYGLCFAYLVFHPMAVKLEKRMEEEVFLMQMIADSLRMISEKWHPRKVEDYLNSYLPPGKRTRARKLADYSRVK